MTADLERRRIVLLSFPWTACAFGTETSRSSSVAAARRLVDYATNMERSLVCALAGFRGVTALAGSEATLARHFRRGMLGCRCSVSHVGNTRAICASDPRGFRASRVERAHIRDLRRQGRGVLFQPGCREPAGGMGRACDVQASLFFCRHGSDAFGPVDQLPFLAHCR